MNESFLITQCIPAYTSVYQTTKSWLKDVHIYITEFKISTFFYTLLETCEVHTAKVICQCMPYFKVKNVYFVCIALTVTSFALYISNILCSPENSNNMYRGRCYAKYRRCNRHIFGGKLGKKTIIPAAIYHIKISFIQI